MNRFARLALAAPLAMAASAFAAAPCAHDSAVGMNARVATMRDQMERIETSADRTEQRWLMELNLKHVREATRELRKREDIPMACRVELMAAIVETMARNEQVAQELQDR